MFSVNSSDSDDMQHCVSWLLDKTKFRPEFDPCASVYAPGADLSGEYVTSMCLALNPVVVQRMKNLMKKHKITITDFSDEMQKVFAPILK